jgi:hypothetical protein
MIPLLLSKRIVHLPLRAGNLQYSRSQVQIISQENSLQCFLPLYILLLILLRTF